MKFPLSFILLPWCLHHTQAAVVSYEVSGYVNGSSGIYNTSTSIQNSGSASNWVSTNNGEYVDFVMADVDTGLTAAHLRVTIGNLVQGNSVGTANVMLAITSNSQSLTDLGTISFLMGTGGNQPQQSATLLFEWYEPNGLFDTPHSNQYTITSYDIDFQQFNGFESAEVETLFLASASESGVDTNLSTRINGSITEVFDPAPGTDATINDVANAVAVRTLESSSQSITLGKNTGVEGNLLFMYEFRNPPQNLNATIIPEPTSSFLFLSSLLFCFFGLRWRSSW